MKDPLIIAGKSYGSRLLVGTGKYRDFAQTRAAVDASGAEIVTVAIRRTNIGQNANEPSLLDALPPSKYTYLPNTAGCYSAADAVRTLRLARELLDGHDLVKLEVLGDPHTLYPNMPETLKAAAELVKDGFKVMVYCSDDPIQAQMLEAAGCVAVMPLASLIGSGMGILNPVEPAAGDREGEGAGAGRRRRRHRVRRRDRHGARLRRRADEHRDRRRAGPGHDGARDAQGDRGRARSLPRRPHAEEALHRRAQLAHRRKDRSEGRLNRPIRSYVLRQGRTTPAQTRALETLYPKYGIAFSHQHISSPRGAPLVLEIGSGMGETTAEIAKAHPEVDFVAVEVHGPGVGSLLNRVRGRAS